MTVLKSTTQVLWLLFFRSSNILALNAESHLGIQGVIAEERAPDSWIPEVLYSGNCFALLNRNLKNSPISICLSPASWSFSTFLQVLILLIFLNDILKISSALEAFFPSVFCCFFQALGMSPSLPEITASLRSSSIRKYYIPFKKRTKKNTKCHI